MVCFPSNQKHLEPKVFLLATILNGFPDSSLSAPFVAYTNARFAYRRVLISEGLRCLHPAQESLALGQPSGRLQAGSVLPHSQRPAKSLLPSMPRIQPQPGTPPSSSVLRFSKGTSEAIPDKLTVLKLPHGFAFAF